MAKEYYDVSYKTYHNERIKPVMYRGKEMHPLYVRVTYDRRTVFFKSYYFDLFSQPKYEFLRISISQIDALESRVIDFLIRKNSERFDLDELQRQYQLYSRDILDGLDGPFKQWLARYLRSDGFPGLSALLEQSSDGVAAIRVWDDLENALAGETFERMKRIAVFEGAPPYISLVLYVRHRWPDGPFCLPLHEWDVENNRIAIEDFLDEQYDVVQYGWIDFGIHIRYIGKLFFPRRNF